MTNSAHNFGKPLGFAVVADCPDNPNQDGMLCGGAHTFKADAEKAARAEGCKTRVVPLLPASHVELLRDALAKLLLEPANADYRDQARAALAATMPRA